MKNLLQQVEEKFIYLYVLTLQNGKYYVGITSNRIHRFDDHRNGKTTFFVKNNLPIIRIEQKLLRTTDRKQAERIETKNALQLMKKYGIDNVSGGYLAGDYHDKIGKLQHLFNAKFD
ncbi:MAG: hypothetical protein A2W99_07330 [Bacteroidetes bacterium GWF2_33_16]|nr:MAG: hypothetical protein A2X00_10280 [Bacteroidetes bacterium GWE2_32_14]OFY03022.1 MAG: hypothetical protein A2W99_07330 [Bacteroidetes bacterium GWF2_33_16]